MIITSNCASPRPATVRLTPSTATEPFRMKYGARSGGNRTVIQCASSWARMSSTRPVPSTWPWTKWPPMRPSARIDRSRFTSCDRRNPPSDVTRAVSGPISAWTSPCSARITVRQTPLTATLSPGASSAARPVRSRSRMPALVPLTSATSPTASINPVNIAFDDHVRSPHRDLRIDQRRNRPRQPVEHGHPRRAEHVRRDEELDVVDEILFPCGPVDRRSAFQQDRLDIEGHEPPKHGREPRFVAGHEDGARLLQRAGPLPLGGFGLLRGHYYHGSGRQGREDAGAGWRPQPPVEDDPRERPLAEDLSRRE